MWEMSLHNFVVPEAGWVLRNVTGMGGWAVEVG